MVYMDEGMKAWIEATISLNLWRVASWYSREELAADALLCYARCRDKYPALRSTSPTKEQRKNFMALFKRAFTNHIHTLSKRRLGEDSIEEVKNWDKNLVCWQDTFLRELLLQLPLEFAEVLVLLANDATTFKRTRRIERDDERIQLRKTATRESTQEHIARLLGGSSQVDYASAFSKYIRE
jgi:hypothetical protein